MYSFTRACTTLSFLFLFFTYYLQAQSRVITGKVSSNKGELLQRGFERYYGILCGASSYMHPFAPRGVTTDNGAMQFDFPSDYYITDVFGDNAVRYIREQKDNNPFFLLPIVSEGNYKLFIWNDGKLYHEKSIMIKN